jgi:hypothetical protein
MVPVGPRSALDLVQAMPQAEVPGITSPGAFIGFFGILLVGSIAMLLFHRSRCSWARRGPRAPEPPRPRDPLPRARVRRQR